jgi:hypothetical protein
LRNSSQTLGFLQKLPFRDPIPRPPGFFDETLLAVWADDRMTLSSSTANRTPPENGFCRRQLVPDASVVFIQRVEESTFSFPSNFGIEPDFLRIGGRDTEQDTSKMGWIVVYMDQSGVLDATSIELIEPNAFFGQNEGVNIKSILLLDETLAKS